MSSEFGVLNLFETSVEPCMIDGVITSDSEAERAAIHLANGKFENEDQAYDNLAVSLDRNGASQCDEKGIQDDDVTRKVTQEESSHENPTLDPDPRDDFTKNICAAAVSDDFIKPVSVVKRRKAPVQEKKEEDASLNYCTIVCQVCGLAINYIPFQIEDCFKMNK